MHLHHGILAPFPAKVMVMRHLIIILALLCVSCNARLPSIKPYKMDIQQGNVVTSKMMLQLKPGMTKSQVRFIMGTPLVQDGFHPDRWDYFYQMRKAGKIIEQRRVIMEFQNDALVRIRGDVIPAGSDQAVEQAKSAAPTKLPPKKAEQKKSLWERLQFWKDDEEPAKPQAAPEELVAPAATIKEKPAPAAPAGSGSEAKPAESERPVSPPEDAAAPEDSPAVAPERSAPDPEAEPAALAAEPAPKSEDVPTETAPAESPASADVAPAPAKAPKPEPAATQEQPAPKAEPASEDVAEPAEDDLPPEDAPGYFERMLEKIGF